MRNRTYSYEEIVCLHEEWMAVVASGFTMQREGETSIWVKHPHADHTDPEGALQRDIRWHEREAAVARMLPDAPG